MSGFRDKMLKHKKISVWGFGYLGYTTVLRLQSKGFFANVFVFENLQNIHDGLIHDTYPSQIQKEMWMQNTPIPSINNNKLLLADEPFNMFDSQIHIIAMPARSLDGSSILSVLSQHFIQNKDKIKDSLVLTLKMENKTSISLTSKSLGQYDCVIIATNHSVYDPDWIIQHSQLIIDTRNMIKNYKDFSHKVKKS